ncbi:MAG: hypothetical protein LBI80_00280 [Endomicrobium sp.]|jgi:hypothetical protein|nr:hypothetical protein [Endomicrobium sp.]
MRNFNVKRYNIYSCITITNKEFQLCFDPAKIRDTDMERIVPDFIFISHESMDHMEPAQVYSLQKKKKAKIFCSIAATVDLIQAFPHDYEFIGSINTLIPGSKLRCENLLIEAQKSIHCDYMMPLIFKVSLIDEKISILHCFDSLISKEISDFSKNTSLAVIPIGIAKGVSVDSGVEFMEKLHSKKFLTNHFKSTKELIEFSKISDNTKCVYLDWNQETEISLPSVDMDFEISVTKQFSKESNYSNLMYMLCNFNSICCDIINDEVFLQNLFAIYKTVTIQNKAVLLFIYTLIGLLDSNKISSYLLDDLKNDLTANISNENNSLNTIILFFLGVYAQQAGQVNFVNESLTLANEKMEHLTYWVVQFLGRSITANKQSANEITEKFLKILSNSNIYNSVVVRRQIFWELYRIMKVIPSLTAKFVDIFEDGLTDVNPDVELLAVLCFGLANKVRKLTKVQLDKIFNLLNDPEDDVRETVLRIVRNLHHLDYIFENKGKLFDLICDQNCHVGYQAELTKSFVEVLNEKSDKTMV